MGNKNIKQTTPTSLQKTSLTNDPINEYYNRDAKEFFTKMKDRINNTIVPLLSVKVDAKVHDLRLRL
jgi:hypothetical protein